MADFEERTKHVFPDAEEMRRWNALTVEEQKAELWTAIKEGLDSPPSGVTTADEIMDAVLARYAADA